MAEGDVKIEQIQSALKAFGLEDTDFSEISSKEITDFTPYVDKVKSNFKEQFLGDKDWLASITDPIRGEVMGKEKQLKKEVRKAFNLQYSEDELYKKPMAELLKEGADTLGKGKETDIEKYKGQIIKLTEDFESLQNSIPVKISEVENTYKTKLQQKDIREELITLVAGETQIQKENIPTFTTALMGYFHQEGLAVSIDDKKNLSLKDAEGLPAKNKDGAILRVKDAIKNFSAALNVNLAPRGDVNLNGNAKNTNNLLEILGTGIQ